MKLFLHDFLDFCKMCLIHFDFVFEYILINQNETIYILYYLGLLFVCMVFI